MDEHFRIFRPRVTEEEMDLMVTFLERMNENITNFVKEDENV